MTVKIPTAKVTQHVLVAVVRKAEQAEDQQALVKDSVVVRLTDATAMTFVFSTEIAALMFVTFVDSTAKPRVAEDLNHVLKVWVLKDVVPGTC